MVQELTSILYHAAHVPSTLTLVEEVSMPVTTAMVVPSHSQLGPKVTWTVVGIYNSIVT